MDADFSHFSNTQLDTLDQLYDRIMDLSRPTRARAGVDEFFDYMKESADNPYRLGIDEVDKALNKFEKRSRDFSGLVMDYASGQAPGTTNMRNEFFKQRVSTAIDKVKNTVGSWIENIAERRRSTAKESLEREWREIAGADFPNVMERGGNAVDYIHILENKLGIKLRKNAAEITEHEIDSTDDRSVQPVPTTYLGALVWSEDYEDRLKAAQAGVGLDVLRYDSDIRIRDAVWEFERMQNQGFNASSAKLGKKDCSDINMLLADAFERSGATDVGGKVIDSPELY